MISLVATLFTPKPDGRTTPGIVVFPPRSHMSVMILALLLAIQDPGPAILDLDLRPPRGEELRAAERRDAKRLPIIIQLCREVIRSSDPDGHVRRFADANGLSSYARLALALDCRLYAQGRRDAAR